MLIFERVGVYTCFFVLLVSSKESEYSLRNIAFNIFRRMIQIFSLARVPKIFKLPPIVFAAREESNF